MRTSSSTSPAVKHRSPAPRTCLRRIAVPTLIVWGREDRFVPLAHAEACHEGIAAPELSLLEAGHSPWLELPEVCAATVTAFLRRP
jgi:pimeloyl-ACP methyl ester carboxylesterase